MHTSGLVVEEHGSMSSCALSNMGSRPERFAPGSDIIVEAAFTIFGHHSMAYQVAGHSSTAIVLGANGQPSTISVGGVAMTIDGQIVSIGNNGVYLVTSDNTESEVIWNTVTGTNLPLDISSAVLSNPFVALSPIATDISAQLVQPSGAEKAWHSEARWFYIFWIGILTLVSVTSFC